MDNNFKERWEQFLIKCDEIGKESAWDEEELGVMYAYYDADLMNVVLYLVASDGEIQEKEVEFINDTFGFDYDMEKLQEVYGVCGESLVSHFDETLEKDIALMKGIDEGLCSEYKELLAMVCGMVIESDGIVTETEKDKAKELQDKLS